MIDQARVAELQAAIDTAPAFEPMGENGQANTRNTGPQSKLIVRKASEINTKAVRWFWQDRFVAGAINLLVGMPDVGKSVLMACLMARVSKGDDWPAINGEAAPCEQGSVAFLSMEDSPEMTIVPRLRAHGADLERIHIVDGIETTDGERSIRDAFDIQHDVDKLETLRQQDPDLRAVVIDPLDSYLNQKLDTNIGNKVRAALWPLKDWAESTGVTVLIVHHFNKAITTNALDKVSGARSFGALPRSVWAVAREEHGERVILAPIKLNLVSRERKKAIAYTLDSSLHDPGVPVVTWCADGVDVSADELLGAKSNKTDEAADWLKDVLADGPMPSGEMKRLADEAGHAWRTIVRAKEQAKVIVDQQREEGKIVGWQWRLP